MKNEPTLTSWTQLLYEIQQMTTDLSVKIRGQICHECQWSIPTYYRKIRRGDKISIVEHKRILEIMSEALLQALTDMKLKAGGIVAGEDKAALVPEA
jgi:hypothetical protein